MSPPNIVAISLFLATAFNFAAIARPGGDWSKTPQEVREWIARQKQPDNPTFSCCGEADAYFADAFEVVDGNVFAIITDDRDDSPLGRPHVPVGTRINVPPHKMVDSRNDVNPSGHGVIFLVNYENENSGEYGKAVLCFVRARGCDVKSSILEDDVVRVEMSVAHGRIQTKPSSRLRYGPQHPSPALNHSIHTGG
jgi:hypothetical protein